MPQNPHRHRRAFIGTVASTLAAARLGLVETLTPVIAGEHHPNLPDEGALPDLGGAIAWLNSDPQHAKSLRGNVVLVNFWTYTCINSLRPLPYLRNWAERYRDAGLIVIGVHTPEFSFEKERVNVERSVSALNVNFPIAIDSNYRIWEAFNNQYWPAQYLVDRKGRIRFHHFGEGEYGGCERAIRDLLEDDGSSHLDQSQVRLVASGIEAPPSAGQRSPETYVGYRRAARFASPEHLAQDSRKTYSVPARLPLNEWGLAGSWTIADESATLRAAPGKVAFRFHSRDLHMVLAPGKKGDPVRFNLRLDGSAPGEDCGVDSDPHGAGQVREPRLYQLIRQKHRIEDRTFEIEFLDPGVQAFAFTFG